MAYARIVNRRYAKTGDIGLEDPFSVVLKNEDGIPTPSRPDAPLYIIVVVISRGADPAGKDAGEGAGEGEDGSGGEGMVGSVAGNVLVRSNSVENEYEKSR